MDWLHCNVCYSTVDKNEDVARFVTTNCGHVYCRTCAGQMTDGKCIQCGASCRVLALDANMPAEIAVFFGNTVSGLKKAAAALKETASTLSKIQQARAFQDNQREHLLSFLIRRPVPPRPPSPPGTVRIQEQELQQFKENHVTIQHLRAELDHLRAIVSSGRQSTAVHLPVSHALTNDGRSTKLIQRTPTVSDRSNQLNTSTIPGGFTANTTTPQMVKIVGHTDPRTSGSRYLPSRMASTAMTSSHANPHQLHGAQLTSRPVMTAAPPRAPTAIPTNSRLHPCVTHESVMIHGRAGAQTPYPGLLRQAAAPAPRPSNMRSATTNRSSGIGRTVYHGSVVGQQAVGTTYSHASSGSSRLVAGPTYHPSKSLVAKRCK